jgi:hypothetical protein
VSLAPLTAAAIGLVALATVLVLRAPTWNDTLIRSTFVGLSGVAVMSGVALLLLATDGPLGGGIAVLPTTDGFGVGGAF